MQEGVSVDAPSFFSRHQADAGGGAQGGRYRRKYRDGEVDDFLPKFFFHGSGGLVVVCFFLSHLSFRAKRRRVVEDYVRKISKASTFIHSRFFVALLL